MPGSHYRTPVIGREQELARLTEHPAGIGRGRGGWCWLLTEFTNRARAHGAVILTGRAYESEGLPPYLPFIEALRGHARSTADDLPRAQLANAAAQVAVLLPELRERWPDLPLTPSLSAEHERYRLFAGVSDFLCAVAGSVPAGLLLVLDDLQWADTATLRLLQHLVHGMPNTPLLVVGAYRTVDPDPGHALTDVVADLSREQCYDRLLLRTFTQQDVATFIAGLIGAPAALSVAAAIYRETEGNAFFVEEAVRQLQEEGRALANQSALVTEWGIPEGVRQVISRWLRRLSDGADRVLQCGSVLGEGPTFALADALSLAPKQRLHLDAGAALERVYAGNLAPHSGVIADLYRLAGAAAGVERATSAFSGPRTPQRRCSPGSGKRPICSPPWRW